MNVTWVFYESGKVVAGVKYIHHLCFKQAQPKMCHSPKVDDGVDIYNFFFYLENLFLELTIYIVYHLE